MPPAASSRSSTYFPKICGNIDAHCTAFRGLWLASVLAIVAGCAERDESRVRVTAHVLPACAIEPRLAGARTLALTPLGDFPSRAAELVELISERDPELAIPEQTRAFEAISEGGPDDLRYFGYAERGATAWVPILLWPDGAPCPLQASPASYPAPGAGQALGYAPAEHLLLVMGGGSNEHPAAAEGAVAFDAGTGELLAVDSAPAEARAFATISLLGDQLLIAGGENPLRSDGETIRSSQSAELFDPARRRFTGSTIALRVERTRHAAVSLPNGDSLLVGGRGPFGALRALELVSAQTRRSSLAGLAALAAARYFPEVLALDDGRWFVAGGTAADDSPLSVVEWLSSDARTHLGAAALDEILPRVDRAFTALPGGGVLALGGCEWRAPADADEAARCAAECRRGCPPPEYDAFWILPDGSAVQLDFPLAAPRPVLLGGGDGRPLLATGVSEESPLYRFDPWRARFELTSILPPAPRAGAARAALDAQAFVWVNDGGGAALLGLRAGTRDHWAGTGTLWPRTDARAEFPSALAPDRPIAGQLELGAQGELEFLPRSDVLVFVAGARFDGFSLELEFDGPAPPRLIVGATELGGAEQPWPAGVESPLRVMRSGSIVSLPDHAEGVYAVHEPRARLGFGAPESGVRVLRVAIERSPK